MKEFVKKILGLCITIALLLCLPNESSATHIVGGEFNYQYIGNDSFYVKIKVYRDQINGVPDFDDPLMIYVYDETNTYLYTIFVDKPPDYTLVPIIDDPCFVEPPNVITEVIAYEDTIYVPNVQPGYKFSYMRCCRNNDILNIESLNVITGDTVDASLTGSNYPAYISEHTLDNGNPEFINYPPLAICVDEPLSFDHSAIDPDGDSLVYKLCTPFTGGFGGLFPPVVYGDPELQAPPFQEVYWLPPYGLENVMGGVPMEIDPQTGLLTAIPNTIGRFVVAICVDEYRDGVLLAEHRRDFQFNIVDCGLLFDAEFEFMNVPKIDTLNPGNLLLCDTTTAKQFNSLVDSTVNIFWDFGDGTTSTEQSPYHVFPDTGDYVVMLIAGVGEICADTNTVSISVQQDVIGADFSYVVGISIDNQIPVQFNDLSNSNEPIVNWDWIFGDGDISDLQNPLHLYPGEDTFNISLFIYAENGCCDRVDKSLFFPKRDECDLENVFIPNAFSPNGDGLNDVFRPSNLIINSMLLEVYDRWGNLIYEGNDFINGWDGKVDGEVLATDSYGYIMRISCLGGEEYLRKGNITLIR